MGWKKLSRRASIRSNKPAMSIQKNGRISWNLGVHEALQHPEHVELLYDPEKHLLGVRRVAEEDLDTFAVRQSGKQRTWGISALGALRGIGIEVDKAFRRYAAVDGGIVAIDIGELVERQLK